MKPRLVSPGRKILEIVRSNRPKLLQRPWYFHGWVPKNRHNVYVYCIHGINRSRWIKPYGLPPTNETFKLIELKWLVTFWPLHIWIGQCKECEKVYWMIGK